MCVRFWAVEHATNVEHPVVAVGLLFDDYELGAFSYLLLSAPFLHASKLFDSLSALQYT